MNWETALQDTLLKCAAIESLPAIASLTDLTLLNSAATEADIKNLVTTALDNHVAAICVFPQHLSWVSDHLRLLLPSPSGRRCHAVTDEDFSGQYVPSDDTLIRPAGTFSQKEKGVHLNLAPLGQGPTYGKQKRSTFDHAKTISFGGV